MKVLMAILKYPPDFAGDGLRFHRMFQRLLGTADISEVHVITSWDRKHKKYEVRNGIHVHRVSENTCKSKYESHGSLLKKCSMPLHMFKVVQMYFSLYRDADVVLTSGSGWMPSLVGWLAWMTRKPLMKEIVLLHSDDPITLARKKFWTRFFFTMPFRFAGVVVTISPPLEKACLEFGIPSEKVWCRLNPVDFPVTVTEKDCLACSGTDSGEPAEVPVVFWAGTVKPRKNVDFLLRAAHHLKPPVRLVFAGPHDDKRYSDQLVDMALKLPQGIDAEFADEIRDKDELIEMYRKARVFWFASHSEGMGNVVAEALVCGTPVVTLPVHGIMQSLLITGEDGEIVPETNPRAFADAVNHWLDKRYHRCEIARRAADRFNVKRTDNAYINWFYKISNNRRESSAKPVQPAVVTGAVLA